MTYYGSDAGEKSKPGSKLQSQAEHIADVLEEWENAEKVISRIFKENICIEISLPEHIIKRKR